MQVLPLTSSVLYIESATPPLAVLPSKVKTTCRCSSLPSAGLKHNSTVPGCLMTISVQRYCRGYTHRVNSKLEIIISKLPDHQMRVGQSQSDVSSPTPALEWTCKELAHETRCHRVCYEWCRSVMATFSSI